MSHKVAPSPLMILEEQRGKKTPLGSVSRHLVENSALPERGSIGAKKPSKRMQEVSVSTSATEPISDSEAPSTDSALEENTMAIAQEVVTAENPVGSTLTEQKAVVTPEGTKDSFDPESPVTPPRVTSVLTKENVEHPAISPPQGLLNTATTGNRSRILSLDRGSVGKSTITGSTQSASSNDDEDSSQADSSDGESSYFAKHLPSPKSGRRFSYSSNHSAPARTSNTFYQAANARASDASLSFSDESDDELPVSESPEPVAQLPSSAPDIHLQTLTRVHSVSSLVSSDDDSHPQAGVLSPQSTLSKDSSASLNADSTVVKKNRKGRSNGQAYGHPPAIMPDYNTASGMIHPQPQMLSPEQFSQWAGAQQYCKPNDGAVPFVYSDDEGEDTPFMQQLAGNGNVPGDLYNTFSNGGTGGGGGGNNGRQGGSSGGGGGNGGNGQNYGSGGGYQQPGGQGYYGQESGSSLGKKGNGGDGSSPDDSDAQSEDENFKVYWQRWIMLFYMSILNLLSDWTCYSVAPIAILTQETFGSIDPERLVVIFLGANAISTALEPIILARLGLKKTVLFGALLLMLGSMIKSGGIPPIIQSQLHKGEDEWRLNFGFFLVGLSQPLYQCTPALLSASWFPERERTMATGVALNANQLGIGCAFIFGTLLVAESDDIPAYFGLLSIISTLAFLGTLFQFEDAPPTPPSSSAKVMKGDFTVPDMGSIINSVRKVAVPGTGSAPESGGARRRNPGPRASAPAPSPASWGKTSDAIVDSLYQPSPMLPGGVRQPGPDGQPALYDEDGPLDGNMLQGEQPSEYPPMYSGMPYGAYPPPPPNFQNPYMDPRMQQQFYYQQQPQFYPPPPHPYYYGYQNAPPAGFYPPPAFQGYGYLGDLDEGVEPVVTITDHHLDIDIRDDQIILSLRACFSRPGFIHALVTFTISGIVINTLSTFMDYLVTLNGAGREYVGIVGGSFQFIIMISSLIIGKQTDKTRAYYTVIIAMLVLGAFGLAECGVSLDADRGSDLRWSLLIVAALVGPLQPVSTELGVDVAYPLSENTVLVIQQLFSNLLSALFIPFFKSLRDIGISPTGSDVDGMRERPQYTFSFYLLIVLHAAATIFFASFNGRYLRYEHELQKQAKSEQKKWNKANAAYQENYSDEDDERHPLTGA